MDEIRIKTLSLKNGLSLHLMDASKKIAGDRWYVCLKARMDIPVNKVAAGFSDRITAEQKIGMDDLVALLGDTVTFEKKMERNFISNEEKDAVLNAFMEAFSKLSSTYLAHPDFAGNYILNEYKKKWQEQTWYR